MASAATISQDELSAELVELLHRGAADHYGLICRPGEVQKNYKHLRIAERLGYLRFIDVTRPWITEEGRAAIGAPTEMQVDHARLVEVCKQIKPKRPAPKKQKDSRTDFDYRSYKTMNQVCIIAVKLHDDRLNPNTIKIGRIGFNEPHFLGPRNSIIMPESEGRFVLALIPHWLQERTKLPTWGFPLPENDQWTDAERATWDRLSQICRTINSRIRNADRSSKLHMPYGFTA